MMLRSVKVALFWAISISPAYAVEAEDHGRAEPGWALDVTTFAFFLRDQPDYLQPTVTADRSALHLEGRFAYEDRDTFSLFGGWNAAAGRALRLEVTPMVGVVLGRTGGIAPGLELTLTWRAVELRSESEYLLAIGGAEASFFYAWSELGLRPARWLRVGLAAQRTKRFHAPREVTFGPMLGVTVGKLEATLYVFDRGSAPPFAALSLSLSL
jgi:hypothetical protein